MLVKRFILITAAAAAVAFPASSFASDSAADAYGGSGQTLNTVASPVVAGAHATKGASSAPSGATSPAAVATPTPTESAASGGSLPFTGLDLALLAAGGFLLIGLGVLMRRVARPANS